MFYAACTEPGRSGSTTETSRVDLVLGSSQPFPRLPDCKRFVLVSGLGFPKRVQVIANSIVNTFMEQFSTK